MWIFCLFVLTPQQSAHGQEEQARIERDGQTVDPSVYYVKQTVGNACGTIAILHAIMNCRSKLQLTEGSFFTKFLGETVALSPIDRAKALEGSEDIEVVHQVLFFSFFL